MLSSWSIRNMSFHSSHIAHYALVFLLFTLSILPLPIYAQTSFPLSPYNPWTSDDFDETISVAWGDMDGDGDLDLAIGNVPMTDGSQYIGGANKVYLNHNGVLQTIAAWTSDDTDFTRSVAWGDMDGDGDLDLAAGNWGSNKVYLNQNGVLQTTAVWISGDANGTYSVTWGDMDGDGDLDLAVGNSGSANKVYLNQNGILQTAAVWISDDSDKTYSIAWGDVDGDGDLDLAAGNDGSANKVYLNQNGVLQTTAAWLSDDTSDRTNSIAWGDMDGDRDLDLVAGNWGGANKVYLNHNGMLQTNATWISNETDFTISTAWGDVDSDGDLDLAVGNWLGAVKVYLNQNGALQTTAAWTSGGNYDAHSVAWGDVDGDGDLDLAVGNGDNGFGEPNKVYFNQSGALQTIATWTSNDTDFTRSIAWGDIDGDSYLDLAIGNEGNNKVYHNQNGLLQTAAVWTSDDWDTTISVAWGDVDDDGDLELAAGNYGSANKIYLNHNGILQTTAAWASDDTDNTMSVAWGDADGDGDLDLAAGNEGIDKIYFNQNGVLQTTAAWNSNSNDITFSIAWGDVDGDGDLDLAVGNAPIWGLQYIKGNNKLYLNQDGVLQNTAIWTSDDNDNTYSMAWGDMDGDGDLDLAAGNYGSSNKVYLNQNGMLQTTATWTSGDSDNTYSIGWGDVDGDGDLDLAAGNEGNANIVYLNNNGVLQTMADNPWTSDESDFTYSAAWGDMDGDGDLDLAVGNYGNVNRIYLNGRSAQYLLDNGPSITASRPITPAVTNFYVPHQLITNSAIPITYTLFDPKVNPVGQVEAFYSFNGDGQWLPAVATTDTIITNLSTSLWPTATVTNTHVYTWNTFASDFFGQSNNVVLRFVVHPQPAQSSPTGTYKYYNSTPLYQHSYASTTTFPFRVRGTQVRVLGTSTDMCVNQLLLTEVAVLPTDAEFIEIYNPCDTAMDLSDIYLTDATYTTAGYYYYNIVTGVNAGGGTLDDFHARFPDDASIGPGEYQTIAVRGSDAFSNTYGITPTYELYEDGASADTIPDMREAIPGSINNQGGVSNAGEVVILYYWDGTTDLVTDLDYFVWGDKVEAVDKTGVSIDGPDADSLNNLYNADTAIVLQHVVALYGHATGQSWQRQDLGEGNERKTGGNGWNGHDETSEDLNATWHEALPTPGGAPVYVSFPQPVSDASVYRLPTGQDVGGFPLANSAGVPFHTDQNGYLQGRGTIGLGDHLLAMLPVSTVTNYAGALTFDGVDDYAIKNPLNSAPITETTVSFWISTTQMTEGAPFSYAVSGKDDELLIANVNNFTLYRGNVSVSTGVTVTDGNWRHLAVVWRDADDQVRLYKDGTLAYSGTLTATAIITGGSLVLGQDQDSIGGGFQTSQAFQGMLDEVQVWNIALTEAQIQDALAGVDEDTRANLVASWSFDDPENPGADASGNDNNLTLSGTTWDGDYVGGYTVYHTNGIPTVDGVEAFTVTQPGVQEIAVTAAHPLILFDLNVSLEWDAHNDPVYLQQLEIDLKKASAYLYDFTNGQVALGKFTVHQNADYWASAHIAVQASNRLRPFASIGGLPLDVFTETVTVDGQEHTLNYGPGQIRMGATWNRYGDPTASVGVDWPLILAHELSHYLLYQYDVYLGLNEGGLLVPEDACTGSAMGDVYAIDNTEFISNTLHWTTACSQTLAAKTLGRTEWETLRTWYPWLITPTLANDGPSRMPFEFTTVEIVSPTQAQDTLEDPTFYLDYTDSVVSSSDAYAFLLRDAESVPYPGPDDFEYIYDLGSPIGGQNRVTARGARPGDRLCVFDNTRAQFGCEIIAAGDERLSMRRDADWQPVIQLTPVNSTTFVLQITELASITNTLRARIFPEFGTVFTPTTLAYTNGIYTATLTLPYPVMHGHVQVWVDEATSEAFPRREALVNYSIGGNPGTSRAGGIGTSRAGGIGTSRAGGIGTSRAGGIGTSRAGGIGSLQTGEAPLVSPDGQMILYLSEVITFAEGQFYTIQAMAGLPDPPAGRTLVGQGYNLVATGFPTNTEALTGSVSIQYLGSDVLVAGADENNLDIYFWDGTDWTTLDTTLNTYFNMASARSQGTGLYALMASLKIPLYGPGWNLFAYPLPFTQTVPQALLSISGSYTTVYGYAADDPGDPWKVYDVTVPEWVNDLTALEFGHGYWINISQTITLYLSSGANPFQQSEIANLQSAMPMPPATFYDALSGADDWSPVGGMAVTAWIDGHLCGQTTTRAVDGRVVYAVNVFAESTINGCGAPGKPVVFQVDGRVMAPIALWDDRQLWLLTLRPAWRVYLPLIVKR